MLKLSRKKVFSLVLSVLLLMMTILTISFVSEPTKVSAAASPLQLGKVLWGACGHRDQGGAYTSIPLNQQIADLKNIFGTTPNTILYRAFGEAQSNSNMAADVTTCLNNQIIPVVMVITYPPWTTFANEAAAYNWAYASVSATATAASNAPIFEIGNEWTLQSPLSSQKSGDGSQPSHWSSAPDFRLHVGAAAGAVAAIRDKAPSAHVIAGAIHGWTSSGYAVALENALRNYNGRNLTWNFTVEHWYNDAFSGGNRMGMPNNFNGGMNAYQQLFGAEKPVIFTEFGSSNNSNSAYDAQAGANITELMSNFVAHMQASGTERGIVGGAIYQLYRQPNQTTKESGYYLYNYSSGSSASIAPMGTSVKTWISQQLENNAIYRIEPANAPGKCLEVSGSGTADGSNVHIWTWWGGNNQKWKAVDAGNGYWKFIPQHATTKALDVYGAATADGTNVQIWSDNGGPAQRWRIVNSLNGYFTLEPACAPGKSLDVNGAGTVDGTNVQIWSDNGGPAQKWKFIKQ